jgi:hypothetical protein
MIATCRCGFMMSNRYAGHVTFTGTVVRAAAPSFTAKKSLIAVSR